MATVTYNGTGGLGADGSYSSTPGSGDTIIVASGSADFSTLDTTALTNIPDNWQFRFGYGGCLTKSLGTASSAVTLEAPNGAVRIDGNNYLQFANISAGTGGSKQGKLKISNVPVVVLTTGTIDEIELDNCGSVVIGSGVVYLKLRTLNGTKIVLDESNATKPTLVEIGPGTSSMDNRRGLANSSTLLIFGRMDFTSSASNGNSSSWIYVAPSGICNGKSSGTIYNIEILPGGSLLASNCIQNQTWTVIRPWKGSTVQRTGVGFTITITGEDSVP